MVFSSTTFLFLFLPSVLLLYYNPWLKSRKFKNILLLLASLGFYAWGEPIFVFLMIFSIVTTWAAGLRLNVKKSKGLLAVMVSYHVAVLFVFKYLSFVASELGVFLQIALPIGISFFTFQLMSYLFDVYYGKAKAQKNVLYLGLYISFFPQLIAGPIVRYSDIAEQMENRVEKKELFASGMQRFIYGLSKKVLIADYVAIIADISFGNINKQSVMMAWLGALAYTLQIYFDFSGYSDMAIGLGRMFGFSFVENFNYPYISKSVTEFWRRWHISLSSWFRDYVYIPLGGNRCTKCRWIFNLFVVWTLTGIWHGANWTFLLWGLLYFVFLLIEKITKINTKLGYGAYVTTAVLVMINWVIFKADTIVSAGAYLGNMVGIGAVGGLIGEDFSVYGLSSVFILVISVLGATPILKKTFEWLAQRKMEWIESVWLVFIFLLSLIHSVAATYSPFIYFNF
jgi:D-alanyl-lipoteichoic acid acyltransferase DltB (MBOAT superfamily)